MPVTYSYPAELERDEEGRYVVIFPDFRWGATDGETLEIALNEAEDLLRELLATTIRERQPMPIPSRASNHRPSVSPPVLIALKAALYDASRKSGISLRQLARDLDVAENELRQMMNPDHPTKTATLDTVLRRMGKRVSLTVSCATRTNRF